MGKLQSVLEEEGPWDQSGLSLVICPLSNQTFVKALL